MKTILVAGAGGFIGGHLVSELLKTEGVRIRAIDKKPLSDWWQVHPGVESKSLDLQKMESCSEAARNVSQIYNLAADMGGMGFIEHNKSPNPAYQIYKAKGGAQ